MKNGKKNKRKKTLSSIKESRDGGQNALRGYSYQFLYSCFLVLSSINEETTFQLEGIEDIDQIISSATDSNTTHIQLKCSTNRQDASFMKPVLKNFLEVYLVDKDRNFELVYDFPVANGNLNKLFNNKLDNLSKQYWKNIIEEIKNSNSNWDWGNYNFDDFISALSFKNVPKTALEDKIENSLIKKYNITTDNLSLFANSIKIFCFNAMQQRSTIYISDLEHCIEEVKNDISKGAHNPAHSWISRIDFSTNASNIELDYFEGKKATPTDIANNLPIHRKEIEKQIIESIDKNCVTVIKSSSGQGKTTLALQVILILKQEYTPYQLTWCNDTKEIGNIIKYFKSRIRVGEKPIVLIDNLDSQFSKWNELAQRLQAEVKHHYKILVTTRETDWYNFSGNKSNIHSLNIIKPLLSKKEAKDIFSVLQKAKKIHSSISNWEKAWAQVSEQKLLIEYIYLLTHGEMLSERISAQMKEIGNSSAGKVKFEILRKVGFADVCGVKLHLQKLIDELSEPSTHDYGEIIKSMEDEFLLKLSTDKVYIEGLHPVRSFHIVTRLHEFYSIDKTALSVVKLTDKDTLNTLFSYFPPYIQNKGEFYLKITETYYNKKDLSLFVSIIEGLFSGGIIEYYKNNKVAFDDANSKGGLFVFATELCPFAQSEEVDQSLNTFDKMLNIMPNNENIKYLINLKDNTPKIELSKTDIFQLCQVLFNKLNKEKIDSIVDLESYAQISEWLYLINHNLNLSNNFTLDNLWSVSENMSPECMSSLMYISYCRNHNEFLKFVGGNFSKIATYLKHKTNSYAIYRNEDNKKIHVEYILRISEINKANTSSVERIKTIGKCLPIFEKYCADSIKPLLNVLSVYKTPDDSHKEMPKENVVIMFNQKLNKLWIDTILSNYESDSTDEWIEHWYIIRNLVCNLMDKGARCLYKILSDKPLGSLAIEYDSTKERFDLFYTKEVYYPNEKKPFVKRLAIPEGLSSIKSKYFQSILNYTNQFAGFIKKDKDTQRLCIFNLKTARSNLKNMQVFFSEIKQSKEHQLMHKELRQKEEVLLNNLFICCLYYQYNEKNKYFNKQWIDKWYTENTSNIMNNAKETLNNLKENFSIDFPIRSYEKEVLSYYPIAINNLDTSNNNDCTHLLINCIPFTETDFDYLTIIFIDDKGFAMPSGLLCSRETLKQYKSLFENDGETREELKAPFPIEITKEMLDCFEADYKIGFFPEAQLSRQEIGFIAEDLWVYSKTRELFSEKSDSADCEKQLTQLKRKIDRSLCSIEDTFSSQEINFITNTYNEVLDSKSFDNIELNNFIEHFS